MVKNPLFDLFAARSFIRGTDHMRQHIEGAVHTALRNATASQGAGTTPPIATYRDSVLFYGAIGEAMSLFDLFALRRMADWHRTGSGAHGTTVFVQYKAARTFNVKLRPRTLWARMNENAESNYNRRHYDRGIEPVAYEYLIDLTFDPASGGTRIAYATQESIDPGARARRDLGRHYAAPALPAGFGAVGDAFLAELRATGRA
jgi:hypothetical protein